MADTSHRYPHRFQYDPPTIVLPFLPSSIASTNAWAMPANGDADTPAQGWPWFSENGIFETLQVVILLVMLTRYLFLVTRHATVLRAIFAGAAMITLACILREVEFDPNGDLGWADRLLRGPGRILAIVIAIPVGLYALIGLLRAPEALPRLLLGNWWGRTCIVGGSIVVLAGLYDRGTILDLPSHRWEEALETVAYLFVAVSSFIPVPTAKAAVARPLGAWGRAPAKEVSRPPGVDSSR